MNKYKTLINDGREYLHTRYDLLRLELLEKTSSLITLLILVMVGLLLAGSVWIYISCILVVWMADFFGGYATPLSIMGGLNLLMLCAVIVFRKQLILNPLIGRLSKILFDNFEEDMDEVNEKHKEDAESE